MKTISIKGIGKAKADPDLVIFNISTSVMEKEYSESIDASNRLINKLKQDLESIGFKKEDLKTTNFTTRQTFEYVEVGVISKKQERQFKGFNVDHDLKLEFELDDEKVNEVLKCLKNFKRNLQFRIDFSVKNRDAMKKEVIVDATRNARFNAEILAEASSVRLGNLIKIEYNWTEINFNSHAYYDVDMLCCDYESSDIQFTPDSIEIRDTVAFVWEIE